MGTTGDSIWRIALATIVAGLFACSSKDDAPQPLSGAQPGTATTGDREPLGPSELQAHEARVRAMLGKSGLALPGDLASWRQATLIDAEIDIAEEPGSVGFSARWRYAGVNSGATPLATLDFSVPANVGRSDPAVRLVGLKVGGEPARASGTTTRWEVPIDAAPGERFEVELELSGHLPKLNEAGEGADPALHLGALLKDLEGVPELGRLVPFVDLVDERDAFGRRADAVLLLGCLPRRVAPDSAPRSILELEVLAPDGLAVDATGTARGQAQVAGKTRHRFVSAGSDEVAVVATRGLGATTQVIADIPVTVRWPAGDTREVLAIVRRALEGIESSWGPSGLEQLTVIGLDGLPGVVAVPGAVLVPTELAFEETPPAAPGPSAGSLTIEGLLGGLVRHHPAAKEALSFSLTTAIARQWWRDAAGDRLAEALIEDGLARVAALEVVAEKGGDKARRRAIELGLRAPVQLALQSGAEDVVLARMHGRAPAIARLKVGLFAEALARHLGEPAMRALTGWIAQEHGVTSQELRAKILAVAPRPDETRALLARWLDQRRLAEDVGPLQPDVLLEYFVADGAIAGLTAQLLERMGPDQLGGRAIELLGQGRELDAGLALQLLAEMAGEEADPAMGEWLSLGAKLLGDQSDKNQAVEGLVDELADKLGVPEEQKAQLKKLSTLLSTMLGSALSDPSEDEEAPATP